MKPYDMFVLPFVQMTWRDVLDILLLALVFYGMYHFSHTRRVGRALIGLAVIVFVGVICKGLRLPTLSAIADAIFASSMFCLVAIFQPEIRGFLENLGSFSFFTSGGGKLSNEKIALARKTTEQTVDAVFRMSEKHCGALLVFEGVTQLGDYIETGKSLNCSVDSPLLLNLFSDKAPLHDGAVIVRNFRIIAASCVLPLSRSEKTYEGMGTRHRAGGGITEVSDALSVIVSEENGTVRVAQNGELAVMHTPEELTDVLMTYFAGKSKKKTEKENTNEKECH